MAFFGYIHGLFLLPVVLATLPQRYVTRSVKDNVEVPLELELEQKELNGKSNGTPINKEL